MSTKKERKKEALAEYNEITDNALTKCRKIRANALAKYYKICDSNSAEYKKKLKQLRLSKEKNENKISQLPNMSL